MSPALCRSGSRKAEKNRFCNADKVSISPARRRGTEAAIGAVGRSVQLIDAAGGAAQVRSLTHLSIWLVSCISEEPVLDLLVQVRDLVKGAFGRGGLCDLEFEDASLITDPRVRIPRGAGAIAQIRVCFV